MTDVKSLEQMIAELLELGLKQNEIAQLAQTSPEQISRIKRGQKAEYLLGKRIELIYLERITDSAA